MKAHFSFKKKKERKKKNYVSESKLRKEKKRMQFRSMHGERVKRRQIKPSEKQTMTSTFSFWNKLSWRSRKMARNRGWILWSRWLQNTNHDNTSICYVLFSSLSFGFGFALSISYSVLNANSAYEGNTMKEIHPTSERQCMLFCSAFYSSIAFHSSHCSKARL